MRMYPLFKQPLFKPSATLLVLLLGMISSPTAQAADTSKMPAGEAKAHASNCFSCHAVDHALVGPSYQQVAQRYAGKGKAVVVTLMRKIKTGGAGNWGDVPMTPHPKLGDTDLKAMVTWILSLKGAAAAGSGGKLAAAPPAETHVYKVAGGKSVKTDFAVFAGPDQKQVTPAVFNGYEQYNSYCFRCHGGDAVGGEYAPDLRKSLANGMAWQQFLSTAMAGKPAKGMPSWAGFFEEKDIRAIYDYVKARQLDLVPPGRPPSAQD
jgi:Cytochrome c551/c552